MRSEKKNGVVRHFDLTKEPVYDINGIMNSVAVVSPPVDLNDNVTRHLRPVPGDDSVTARRIERERAEIDRELPLDDLDDAIEQLVLGVLEIADITRPRRPIERTQPKVGRNDPCPCGSGRKYKQCHGREGG